MVYTKSLPFRLISSSIPGAKVLDFDLPPELGASEPPEARGLARDEVRLMVSYRSDDRVVHSRFRNIGDFLRAGDLLVINTSDIDFVERSSDLQQLLRRLQDPVKGTQYFLPLGASE